MNTLEQFKQLGLSDNLLKCLKEKGFEVDRKQILIKEDSIKEIGKHTARVKFHRDVIVDFEFEVIAE